MAVVTPQIAQWADSGLRCMYSVQAVPLIFTLVIVQMPIIQLLQELPVIQKIIFTNI